MDWFDHDVFGLPVLVKRTFEQTGFPWLMAPALTKRCQTLHYKNQDKRGVATDQSNGLAQPVYELDLARIQG
jgi:hypothetical protein